MSNTNELISIYIEKFNLNNMELRGLHEEDILWDSKNDKLGLSWNISSGNIEMFEAGFKIGYLSKHNISNNYSEIDLELYEMIIRKMIKSIKSDNDIKLIIEKRIKKLSLFENYEEASILKNFKDQCYG
jgi:hypothetical protein